MWRWRKAMYSFNLTVINSDEEYFEKISNNICDKKFVANYKKLVKLDNETINICKENLSPKMWVTSTG